MPGICDEPQTSQPSMDRGPGIDPHWVIGILLPLVLLTAVYLIFDCFLRPVPVRRRRASSLSSNGSSVLVGEDYEEEGGTPSSSEEKGKRKAVPCNASEAQSSEHLNSKGSNQAGLAKKGGSDLQSPAHDQEFRDFLRLLRSASPEGSLDSIAEDRGYASGSTVTHPTVGDPSSSSPGNTRSFTKRRALSPYPAATSRLDTIPEERESAEDSSSSKSRSPSHAFGEGLTHIPDKHDLSDGELGDMEDEGDGRNSSSCDESSDISASSLPSAPNGRNLVMPAPSAPNGGSFIRESGTMRRVQEYMRRRH